mgnify:FL=1|jgi:hypothetical protein|tara:strand:+ start:163 stop:843 length:681 start_codon:yes stop_codon:yes gene_type:complete
MAQRFWESLGYSVINEFLSLFLNKDGFSKSARYEVVIGLPKAATSTAGELLNTETARKVSYHAETIAFPGRNLEIKEDLSTYGPTREIVSGSSYEDLSATFYVATDHREKKFFSEWQNSAHSNEDFNARYYYDYVGSVDIYQLDEEDRRRLGIRLMEAFPKTIGAIDMGYANANQINKMSVSFSYRFWEIIPGDLANNFLNRLANIAINQVERKLIAKLPKVLTRL